MTRILPPSFSTELQASTTVRLVEEFDPLVRPSFKSLDLACPPPVTALVLLAFVALAAIFEAEKKLWDLLPVR